jgi:flagellar hook protein FlgE
LQNVQGYEVQVSAPQMTTQIVTGLTLDGAGLVNAAAGFDATDPLTYNHATSVDIVDSTGLSHNVKSFFLLTVPQGTGGPPAAGNNTWQAYHQLDGGSTIIDGGTVII